MIVDADKLERFTQLREAVKKRVIKIAPSGIDLSDLPRELEHDGTKDDYVDIGLS